MKKPHDMTHPLAAATNANRARQCVAFLTNHGLLTLSAQGRLIRAIHAAETKESQKPRWICPQCRRAILVVNGRFRAHGFSFGFPLPERERCKWSGQPLPGRYLDAHPAPGGGPAKESGR